MESRNVTLTLDKAKEFYNSGNDALREIALQAYTKDELIIPEWQNIKTFEDACKALNIDNTSYVEVPYTAGEAIVNHLYAIYKLDIIRKALNKDWKPSFTEHIIYYPCVRIHHSGKDTKNALSQNKNLISDKSFITNNEKYNIVCGNYDYHIGGLIQWGCNCGIVNPSLGLLACKNKEIAKHMSHYFAKEIFEATYAHYLGLYNWV